MIQKYIKRRLQGEFKASRSIIRTNEEYRIIQKRNKQIQEGMSSCFFFFFRLPSAGKNSSVPVWPPSSSGRVLLPLSSAVGFLSMGPSFWGYLPSSFLLPFLFGMRALSRFRFSASGALVPALFLFFFFRKDSSRFPFLFLLFFFPCRKKPSRGGQKTGVPEKTEKKENGQEIKRGGRRRN